MKKKLITALATRFAGVDAKVLDRIADNILKAKTIETEEDVNSAAEEVTFSDILKSYGDARATEATKAAVSNYEKKHGLRDGKPVNQTAGPTEDDDDEGEGGGTAKGANTQKQGNAKTKGDEQLTKMLSLMESYSKKIDALGAELSSIKTGRIKETRQARLSEVLKPLSELQRKAYQRMSVDSYSDEEFDALIDEIKGEVVDIDKENKARGNAFSAPMGGSGPRGQGIEGEKASDAELEELVSSFKI